MPDREAELLLLTELRTRLGVQLTQSSALSSQVALVMGLATAVVLGAIAAIVVRGQYDAATSAAFTALIPHLAAIALAVVQSGTELKVGPHLPTVLAPGMDADSIVESLVLGYEVAVYENSAAIARKQRLAVQVLVLGGVAIATSLSAVILQVVGV